MQVIKYTLPVRRSRESEGPIILSSITPHQTLTFMLQCIFYLVFLPKLHIIILWFIYSNSCKNYFISKSNETYLMTIFLKPVTEILFVINRDQVVDVELTQVERVEIFFTKYFDYFCLALRWGLLWRSWIIFSLWIVVRMGVQQNVKMICT